MVRRNAGVRPHPCDIEETRALSSARAPLDQLGPEASSFLWPASLAPYHGQNPLNPAKPRQISPPVDGFPAKKNPLNLLTPKKLVTTGVCTCSGPGCCCFFGIAGQTTAGAWRGAGAGGRGGAPGAGGGRAAPRGGDSGARPRGAGPFRRLPGIICAYHLPLQKKDSHFFHSKFIPSLTLGFFFLPHCGGDFLTHKGQKYTTEQKYSSFNLCRPSKHPVTRLWKLLQNGCLKTLVCWATSPRHCLLHENAKLRFFLSCSVNLAAFETKQA